MFCHSLIATLFFGIAGHAAAQIIPLPAVDEPRPGSFTLQPGAWIAVGAGNPEATPDFIAPLNEAGAAVRMAPQDVAAAIQLLAPAALPAGSLVPSGDGYLLRITPEVVNLYAATPAGHLHAIQSLAQIIAAAPQEPGQPVTLACREIVDSPRFAWRGFMLDESRHFSGPAAVKRLLDGMARYKLNRLHWHLTDSPAWRIEIKKYPELTRIGGRGSETDRRPDAPAAFYTQEQIREIVVYARERGITIIPEIDMPGHADAAVTAYPEHDGGGYLAKGSTNKWPRFTFNPARPATLGFLDDILAEVAALFPDAGIIHFGGDEVHFGWHKWPELPEVKDLMARENLKDLAAVEAWFNRRMAATINRLGFKTGGWDEIAARNLPTDKTVIWWWRHDKPAVLRQALQAGYPVILCPRRPLYFDFVQHDSHKVGRRWGGFNPLQDTYQFPAALKLTAAEERGVLGIQACLWTETTVTQARRDFMTWPRLIALAEAAWTRHERKDFTSFQARLQSHLAWLKARGIGYYDPFANSPEITDHGAKPEYLDTPGG
ncbi:MAG: beta-N-acetylhexosaminidase [Akkermansiaceae bacterium]|jgi:hexosaminidase|nr:beta-N-acetylhexosaminidase [Akkermansiaceae bacterium]